MNQSENFTHTHAPISTVIKHIKIYSDNPIHDAIDVIIDSCAGLDEGNEHALYHALNLKDAAEKLYDLTLSILIDESYKYRMGVDAKKPN